MGSLSSSFQSENEEKENAIVNVWDEDDDYETNQYSTGGEKEMMKMCNKYKE